MKAFLLAALALVGITAAQAAEFSVLRPQQSSVAFVSRQMGVSVDGDFKRFSASITVDPAKPEQGKARLDIDIASIDVAAEAYEEVIGPAWFDTAKYPRASFVSDKVTRTAPGRYAVSGKMTIRDVTREITAPFTLEQKGDALVIDGSLPIRRLDYGIGTGIWSDTDTVADEVSIKFRLTLGSKK
jgi:polyisoprenoid-binding protein YceI